MNKREFMPRLRTAIETVEAHISGNHDGSKYGRGLSREGFAGGYAQALIDVEAILNHDHASTMSLSITVWARAKETGK